MEQVPRETEKRKSATLVSSSEVFCFTAASCVMFAIGGMAAIEVAGRWPQALFAFGVTCGWAFWGMRILRLGESRTARTLGGIGLAMACMVIISQAGAMAIRLS